MWDASATRRDTGARPGRGVPLGCPRAGPLRCRPSSACRPARLPRAFANPLRPGGQRAGSPPRARPRDARHGEEGDAVPHRRRAATTQMAPNPLRPNGLPRHGPVCGVVAPRRCAEDIANVAPPCIRSRGAGNAAYGSFSAACWARGWPRPALARKGRFEGRRRSRRPSHGCWPSKLHGFASRAASVCSDPSGRGRLPSHGFVGLPRQAAGPQPACGRPVGFRPLKDLWRDARRQGCDARRGEEGDACRTVHRRRAATPQRALPAASSGWRGAGRLLCWPGSPCV